MDKQKILELADFMESSPLSFDMSRWGTPSKCGSAGCIGGFGRVLFYMFDKDLRDIGQHMELTSEQTEALMFDPVSSRDGPLFYREVTRTRAVATLRRLAATGEVDFL